MKKVICFVLGATLAVAAGAQTWQDALLFSENNYSGTARGVGMGNALTAIGGDAGSLTFNPAGSAVASYSQFEITPGVTFSLAQVGAADGMTYMADKRNTFFGAAKLPNVGFIINMNSELVRQFIPQNDHITLKFRRINPSETVTHNFFS